MTTAGLELRGLFLSPDDQWLGYMENSFALKKVASHVVTPVSWSRMNRVLLEDLGSKNGTVHFRRSLVHRT